MLASGALTVNTSGDWSGTFDGQEGSWYIANSFSTTSATYWEAQQDPRDSDDLSDNYLSDLGDVSTTSLAVGDLLYYTGTQWTRIATSSLGLSTTDITEGDNLFYSDNRVADYIIGSTTIPNVGGTSAGDLLVWNGTTWITTSTSTLGTTLASLTDVDTTGATGGDILYFTGTQWEVTSTSTLVADADLGTLATTSLQQTLTITGGTNSVIGNVITSYSIHYTKLYDSYHHRGRRHLHH